MSFKLLNISSMYPGYLEAFRTKFRQVADMSYQDHYDLLLNDTTEFAGSYNRYFRRSGIDAKCIICNDSLLQKKWKKENSIYSNDQYAIIFEQIKSFKPDILWVEDLNYISESWLKHIRREVKSIRLTAAYHCAPFQRSLLEKLKLFDLVVTCTPGIKEFMEQSGMKTFLVYHGFDGDTLNRLDNQKITEKNKLIFSGSLFPGGNIHNKRIEFIESLLKANLDLKLFVNLEKDYKIKIKQAIYHTGAVLNKLNLSSLTEKISVFDYARSPVRNYSAKLLQSNHKSVFGIDMYNLINASNIMLNMHVDVAGNYAGNMRMFEVTGIGSCLLTDMKENLGDLFEIGTEVVAYNSVEDCIEKVKWLMDHEEERQKIADRGKKKTLNYHTINERCIQIIDILTNEISNT